MLEVSVEGVVDMKAPLVWALRHRLRKGFFRNLSIVASGTAVAQIITVACTPVLTRMYRTEAFGVFGVFMVWIGLVSCVSSGRYHMAVMLSRSDDDAVNVAILAGGLSVLTGLLLLLLLPVSGRVCTLLGAPELTPYVIWLPIITVVSGWFAVLNDWAGRNNNFVLIFWSIIVGSAATNGWKVWAGLLDPSAKGLIVSTFVMFAAQCTVLLQKDFGRIARLVRSYCSYSKIKCLAKQHRRLPIYRAPKDFLNALSQSAPVLMLSLLFSADKAGLFVLVDRVLRAPSAFLGDAVRRVFYPKAADIYHEGGSLYSAVTKATAGLAAIGAPPFLVVVVFGPKLFGVVFGEQWVEAGIYARWVGIAMYSMFISEPAAVLVPVLRLERSFLIFEVVSLGIRVLGLLLGGVLLHSDTAAIVLFSLLAAASNVIYIAFVIGQTWLGRARFLERI